MPKGKSKYFNLIFALGDVLILISSFALAYIIRFNFTSHNSTEYFLLEGYMISVWILIAINFKLYDIPRLLHIDKIIVQNLNALGVYFLIIASSVYLLFHYDYSRLQFVSTFMFFFLGIILWRILIKKSLYIGREKGRNSRTIIFAGGGNWAHDIYYKLLKDSGYGYQLKGVFDHQIPANGLGKYYQGQLHLLEAFCKQQKIDDLLIALPNSNGAEVDRLVKFAENHMIRVQIIPEFTSFFHKSVSIEYFENLPILSLRTEPLESLTNRMVKRLFDIVFSLLIIIFLLSWLFPLLAILIKMSSKGPVFFTQLRSGRDNREFICYKFRTMAVNNLADQLQATANDPRITKLGAFMRKTNLDELPQFINVLLNQMSVVGPRPHMLTHTKYYRKIIDKYMVRQYAKPGITGWAQVIGLRGETKEVSDMEKRAKADIWYIENWSLVLDVKIIFLTVLAMIKGDTKAY